MFHAFGAGIANPTSRRTFPLLANDNSLCSRPRWAPRRSCRTGAPSTRDSGATLRWTYTTSRGGCGRKRLEQSSLEPQNLTHIVHNLLTHGARPSRTETFCIAHRDPGYRTETRPFALRTETRKHRTDLFFIAHRDPGYRIVFFLYCAPGLGRQAWPTIIGQSGSGSVW